MSFCNKINFNKPATPKGPRCQSPETMQKTLTRPGSASLINKCLFRLIGEPNKCHGNVMRKIETLEKQQNKWKDRASAWDKEKKGYIQAMENISKNSAEFFKEHLQKWNDSRSSNKIEDNLQGVISWIKKQDESVLLIIRDVLAEKIPDFISKSPDPGMEDSLKFLMEQNEQLSSSLLQIENELRSKAEGVESLKEKLNSLKAEILEKDSALIEERALNEELLMRIEVLEKNPNFKSEDETSFKNELENKEIEIVVLKTQNTQLQCSIIEYQQSNDVYIRTIEGLKEKLQNIRTDRCESESLHDLSSLEDLDSFSNEETADVAVQTDLQDPIDHLQYVQCMASAVEELLSQKKLK